MAPNGVYRKIRLEKEGTLNRRQHEKPFFFAIFAAFRVRDSRFVDHAPRLGQARCYGNLCSCSDPHKEKETLQICITQTGLYRNFLLKSRLDTVWALQTWQSGKKQSFSTKSSPNLAAKLWLWKAFRTMTVFVQTVLDCCTISSGLQRFHVLHHQPAYRWNGWIISTVFFEFAKRQAVGQRL